MPLPRPLPSPPWRILHFWTFHTTACLHRPPHPWPPSAARPIVKQTRHFASKRRKSSFPKLRKALRETKMEWYAIPVGLGIGVVALTHLRNIRAHSPVGDGGEEGGSVAESRRKVRPMGSWQVHVLSTLPLKAMSYYWGRFNEIPLPRPLRSPGFKLYAYIFGVSLDEVEKDLTEYRNLAEFFYRRLKPGVRPIDGRSEVVVSPADGKVLQFGEVAGGGRVEQVKGMSYSLDALLGAQDASGAGTADRQIGSGRITATTATWEAGDGGKDGGGEDIARVTSDEEFANVNGISYTLPSLLSGDSHPHPPPQAHDQQDASIQPSDTASVTSVGIDLTKAAASSWWTGDVSSRKKRLFFAVVYLAPGDYHRFHSPVNWVVEQRRHFAGELYSVSPYLQNRLPNLFTLNERVVLLGRWKHGMFSMTPVGATNVGSIKIHFDKELRTNSLTHDATDAGKTGLPFAEAAYKGSSALLGGHPAAKGAEVGGFNLGSTIVLVFEAPGDAGTAAGGKGGGGFRFLVKRGQRIKVGEALGIVDL